MVIQSDLFMQRDWDITDISVLPQVTAAVLAELQQRQNDSGSAAVLALHGDLGAGKTTFMQTLAQALGVTEAVTSPTFVVMKHYELDGQSWQQLVHMDAYRLESIDELRPLRFAELCQDNNVIIGIEWAEKITPALPAHTLHVWFTITGEARNVTVDG